MLMLRKIFLPTLIAIFCLNFAVGCGNHGAPSTTSSPALDMAQTTTTAMPDMSTMVPAPKNGLIVTNLSVPGIIVAVGDSNPSVGKISFQSLSQNAFVLAVTLHLTTETTAISIPKIWSKGQEIVPLTTTVAQGDNTVAYGLPYHLPFSIASGETVEMSFSVPHIYESGTFQLSIDTASWLMGTDATTSENILPTGDFPLKLSHVTVQ